MKNLTLAALTLALSIGFTGCTAETAAPVKEKGDSASVITKEDSDAESEEETGPTTASLGDTVTVGNWDIKVTNMTLNANATIAKANMFNDKPKGQYVLVTYQATYTGAERMGNISADLTWSFTDTANNVHSEAMAVTVADNQSWPTEARKGGTIKHQVVFDLAPKAVKGGILTVEGYDDEFNTVYADFAV